MTSVVLTDGMVRPPPYPRATSSTVGSGGNANGSNASDSGVSTPDSPQPPRRVIREVVV